MKKLIVAAAAGRSGSKAKDAETLTAFDLLTRAQRGVVVGCVFALMLVGFWQTAVAAAPTQFENERVTVSYADLNIHSAAGARVLYSRLQAASRAVCNVEPYRLRGSLSRMADARNCFADALDAAVAAVDSAALKRIHSDS